MKKYFFIILLSFLSLSIFAQNSEGSIGLFLGGSYYVGEFNPRGVFYHPSPAVGVMYRHSFDERFGFRIEGSYLNIKGSDMYSSNTYQQQRNMTIANGQIGDLGAQVEINFKNYNTDDLFYDYFSPYLTTGALVSILPDSQRQFEFAVPIGFGFKYALTKTITAGLEWNYRWTNSDMVDGIEPDNYSNGDKQMSSNKDWDWYSMFGVVISVRVTKDEMACPAF